MVFVNSKLGNGFVINAADSSKDQEHYFGGHKKYHGFKVRFLSGSGGTGFGGADYISSSGEGLVTIYNSNGNTYTITGSLYDQNNVYLADSDYYSFLESVLLNGSGSATNKIVAKMTWELSSTTVITDGEFFAYNVEAPCGFYDEYNYTGDNLNTDKLTVRTSISASEEGWIYFKRAFPVGSGSLRAPKFAMTLIGSTGDIEVKIEVPCPDRFGNTATSSFRNIELVFLEPLSDGGVERYKNIDNQHNEDIQHFIYDSPLTKVE
jgi:hypothetical protein